MVLVEYVLSVVAQLRAMLPLSLLSLILCTVSCLITLVQDPLKTIPGPTTTRYTALWYLHKIYRGKFHFESIQLHEKHGKIIRIAPNMYSIDDLEAARTIYGHGSKFLKADWYSSWTAPAVSHLNLFAMQDAKAHGLARRQFANYYSMSSMVHYEEYVDGSIRTLHRKLVSFSSKRQVIDMGAWLQYYAFDVVTNITFGKPFGYLERAEDINNMIAKLDQSNLYSALIGLFPSIHSVIVRVGESPAQIMIDYIKDIINHRKANVKVAEDDVLKSSQGEKARTEDLLQKFLTAHRQEPARFTSTHILLGCVQNIFAGSDTTAIALSSTIFYLARNPSCLVKLRTEINAASAKGTISDPITFGQSQALPYLQAVIKEALRINPAVGLPLVRVVPTGGAMLCGRFFPEGAVVGINPWVAHYNKSIFGEDAHIFRPERWLDESDPLQATMMEQYFMPFGQGSRTCIGKHISLLEVGKLIPQLVRYFDFEVLSSQDRLSGQNHWFVKPHGFEVIPRKI